MKYKSLESQATYQKDIGAFYGVNRTNKINDYQVSECSNMDCGSFPYFSTRGKRELFSNGEKMAILCSDTDITDEYAVTGVTEDGNFVYREHFIDCGGVLSGNSYVVEHLGDYVMLPGCRVIKSTETHLEGIESVYSFTGGGEERERAINLRFKWTSGYFEYYEEGVEKPSMEIRSEGIYITGYRAWGDNWFGDPYILEVGGMLGLDGITYQRSPDKKHRCIFPDGLYAVVRNVSCYKRTGTKGAYKFETQVRYEKFSDVKFGKYISYLEIYDSNNEKFDLYKWMSEERETILNIANFDSFVSFDDDNGRASVTFVSSSSDKDLFFNYLACVKKSLTANIGASFGGRLFLCDAFGVDVFYSSGSMDADEKYNFTPDGSSGGAGFVSCGDPGKWTAMCVYGGALYAFKKNGMYRIYSPDGLSFYMERVADIGALSEKCVCVVSDVMYFLSETGLCRFTGTYPTELPDNYGKKYTDGVLGGVDNKVYCSVKSPEGNELLVYDAEVNAYGVHDKFYSGGFVSYCGRLYALDKEDGFVYEITDERESVDFSFDTRKFFLGFTKKAVNGVRLYFDFSGEEGESFEVLVSYDGGEFERCFAPVTNGKLKYIPIKFKKCDEMVLRVAGRGVFTLKGMSLSLYSGGDIKQNR